MAYLTADEYQAYGLTAVDDAKFNGMQVRAGLVLDQLTRRYYRLHDLDSDKPLRKDAFKLALALQIEYMQRTGIITLEDARAARQMTSQSIGGTSVNLGSSGGYDALTGFGVCDDVLAALSGTGLLWRGVSVC